jgi:flagellin-specific chaperone FliS
MLKIKDKNEVVLKTGDIINIHQTVNGENLFVILDIGNFDVRYSENLNRIYEYNVSELLDVDEFEKTIEIVGNIYNYLHDLKIDKNF